MSWTSPCAAGWQSQIRSAANHRLEDLEPLSESKIGKIWEKPKSIFQIDKTLMEDHSHRSDLTVVRPLLLGPAGTGTWSLKRADHGRKDAFTKGTLLAGSGTHGCHKFLHSMGRNPPVIPCDPDTPAATQIGRNLHFALTQWHFASLYSAGN